MELMKLNPDNVKLRRGDIFCTRNPMMMGKIINAVQSLYARDRKSTYSHAGIILDEHGNTLESLWTVSSQNIWEAYKGEQILIGRPISLDQDMINEGIRSIRKHIGQKYPIYRIFFFLIPPLARRVVFKRLVCSELTAKYLYGAGLDIVWEGKMPDDIDEMITYHYDFSIVGRGEIE